MQKDEYMAAFRLGAPVTFRGIRYRCISAVVCRRMINKSQSMDAPRIYMELELLDNCGHSVTLANPREVDVVDAEMFEAAVRAKNAQDGGAEIDHPAAEAEEAEAAQKPKRKRFVKPTAAEVLEYCAEKGYTHVDVDAFMAHYESVGWRVGKKSNGVMACGCDRVGDAREKRDGGARGTGDAGECIQLCDG